MKGIDSIVPINEEHRRRLERTKANLRKLQEHHNAEDMVNRLDVELIREGLANTRELTQLRIELNHEIRDALFQCHAEQTELVQRIVRKLRIP